jgi:MYXO-CTERM domain-containing protein
MTPSGTTSTLLLLLALGWLRIRSRRSNRKAG